MAVKIVEMQTKFFEEGTLGLQDFKDAGCCRCCRDPCINGKPRYSLHKYAQTPKGIFELKYFFTGGFMNADGNMESWEATRQKLAKIVNEEDKSQPLKRRGNCY